MVLGLEDITGVAATIASEVNKGRLGLEDTTGVGVGVDEVATIASEVNEGRLGLEDTTGDNIIVGIDYNIDSSCKEEITLNC